MQVVEIFQSIQGEGTLIGSQMIFIRLWGCNMACVWCDTTYSWSAEFKEVTQRKNYTPESLSVFVRNNFQKSVEWINFTGGEPTLWASEILETIKLIQDRKISIQTNGKKWHEDLFSLVDKVCMDFKCPASGEKSDLTFLSKLRSNDEAKFVIENENDLDYVKSVLKDNPTNANIIIQPVLSKNQNFNEYYDKIRWLVTEFQNLEISKIRILPQYHQLLWRDQPGT